MDFSFLCRNYIFSKNLNNNNNKNYIVTEFCGFSVMCFANFHEAANLNIFVHLGKHFHGELEVFGSVSERIIFS